MLTTVVLVALEQNSLGIYYTVYIIEALIVTELYVYFNAKARRRLNLVSAILSGGFLIIVFLQAIKFLA
ncbi:hypothetical protein ACFLYE_03055 [Chloroflexota bacterium]